MLRDNHQNGQNGGIRGKGIAEFSDDEIWSGVEIKKWKVFEHLQTREVYSIVYYPKYECVVICGGGSEGSKIFLYSTETSSMIQKIDFRPESVSGDRNYTNFMVEDLIKWDDETLIATSLDPIKCQVTSHLISDLLQGKKEPLKRYYSKQQNEKHTSVIVGLYKLDDQHFSSFAWNSYFLVWNYHTGEYLELDFIHRPGYYSKVIASKDNNNKNKKNLIVNTSGQSIIIGDYVTGTFLHDLKSHRFKILTIDTFFDHRDREVLICGGYNAKLVFYEVSSQLIGEFDRTQRTHTLKIFRNQFLMNATYGGNEKDITMFQISREIKDEEEEVIKLRNIWSKPIGLDNLYRRGSIVLDSDKESNNELFGVAERRTSSLVIYGVYGLPKRKLYIIDLDQKERIEFLINTEIEILEDVVQIELFSVPHCVDKFIKLLVLLK